MFAFNRNPYFQQYHYVDHLVGLRIVKRNFILYCICILILIIAFFVLSSKTEQLIATIIENLNGMPCPALTLGVLSCLLFFMFQKQYYFFHIGEFIRPMIFTAIILFLYFLPNTRIFLITVLSPLIGIISISLFLKLFFSAIKSVEQAFQKRAILIKQCCEDLNRLSQGSLETRNWDDYCLHLPAEDINIWSQIVSDYTDLKNTLEKCRQNCTLDQHLQYMNPKCLNGEGLTGTALRIHLLFSKLSKVFRYG